MYSDRNNIFRVNARRAYAKCTGYIEGRGVLPILNAGDLNLTSNNFHDTLRGAGGAMVMIATARSCHRCIHLEIEYQAAHEDLRNSKVRLCKRRPPLCSKKRQFGVEAQYIFFLPPSSKRPS